MKQDESWWQRINADYIGDRAVVLTVLVIMLLVVTGVVPGLFAEVAK
jgi:hypothetical protein